MNRQEIIKFYENKIDDIKDEKKKEDLFDELTDIENLMISLEGEIDEEIENQESDYIEDEIKDDYSYYKEVLNK